MAAKNVIEIIVKDVTAAQEQGTENISAEKLLSYLKNLQEFEAYDHDIQMELLKSSNVANLEIIKLDHAATLEAFRSVISVGANAAKAFMIINGGAAIALLAFLGNIWNKTSTPDAATSVASSLLIFCIGVLCSGICSGFTYLAQYCFAASDLKRKKFWRWAGEINNVIAVLSGLASLALFGMGAYSAYTSVGNQFARII